MITVTTFDATGMRSATIKTTRHEKARVLVMFAANAGGTKLKPMVVFKVAKREVPALNNVFKCVAVVATYTNGH